MQVYGSIILLTRLNTINLSPCAKSLILRQWECHSPSDNSRGSEVPTISHSIFRRRSTRHQRRVLCLHAVARCTRVRIVSAHMHGHYVGPTDFHIDARATSPCPGWLLMAWCWRLMRWNVWRLVSPISAISLGDDEPEMFVVRGFLLMNVVYLYASESLTAHGIW